MDVRKLELKGLKRADKRAKRQHVAPWKTFALIFLVSALVLTPVSIGAKLFDNLLSVRLDGSFAELKNPSDDAVFSSDQTPPLLTMEQTVAQVQAEGMVLLENTNNALPLPNGTPVSCVSNETGRAEALQKALAENGTAAGNETVIAILTDGTLLPELSQRKAVGEIGKLILLWNTENPVQPSLWKDCGADAVLWTAGADAKSIAGVLMGASPDGSLPYTGVFTGSEGPKNGYYTGYYYYETRYEDYVTGAEGAGEYGYSEAVAYPFGFGLGYSQFAYSDLQVSYDDKTDCFAVAVTVTNTGEKTARQTVQIYAQSPYTSYDREHGVEKPAVKLVGFAKTQLLEPGSSATVTVQVEKRELASYDSQGAEAYILEAGDYYLTVADHAHDGVNHILSARGYTPENTENRMDAAGDAGLTYKWTEKTSVTYGESDANRFDSHAQGPSRKDWEGTLDHTVSLIKQSDIPYNPGEYPAASMPTTGAKNALKLYDLKGIAFDDPMWQTLLDQLTFREMAVLIGDAYGCFLPAKSVQAPGLRYIEAEPPVNELQLAATFNPDLAYAAGYHTGKDTVSAEQMIIWKVDGGIEDGYLAGRVYARQVKGLTACGTTAALKTAGEMLSGSEQTLRERTLRVLQAAVEENPTAGLVTGEKALIAMLRQEWNGLGVVLAESVSAVDGVMAGVTAFTDLLPQTGKLLSYRNDPVVVSAMRQACHYRLYTLVNSGAMNGIGADTAVKTHWLWGVIGSVAATGVCYIAGIVFAVLWGRGSCKWRKTEAHLVYKTLKNTLKAECK